MIFAEAVEVWIESDEEIVNDVEMSPPSIHQSNEPTSGKDKKMFTLVNWIRVFLYYLRQSYGLSDVATSMLLKFLAVLFGILGTISHPCSVIAKHLPSSLYMLQKSHSKLKQFYRYVVCKTQCIHWKKVGRFGVQVRNANTFFS